MLLKDDIPTIIISKLIVKLYLIIIIYINNKIEWNAKKI